MFRNAVVNWTPACMMPPELSPEICARPLFSALPCRLNRFWNAVLGLLPPISALSMPAATLRWFWPAEPFSSGVMVPISSSR